MTLALSVRRIASSEVRVLRSSAQNAVRTGRRQDRYEHHVPHTAGSPNLGGVSAYVSVEGSMGDPLVGGAAHINPPESAQYPNGLLRQVGPPTYDQDPE